MSPDPSKVPPIFLAALVALRRARMRAIDVAISTNTCLIIAVDGQIVRVPPDQLAVDKP